MKLTEKYIQVYDTDSSLIHYTSAISSVGILDAESKILKMLKLPKKALVADLGSGPGRFAFGANKLYPAYQIDCYDLSDKSIQIGKDLASKMNLKNISFTKADLTEKGCLKPSYYNLCFFTFNSLMTIPGHNNKKKALLNAYNALKSGGYLVFTAPTISGDINRENFIKNNLSNEHERKSDISYQIDNKLGVLCHYEKEEIFQMLDQINLPKPIFASKRDEFAIETKEAKIFSDNAVYYIIKKP